MITIVYYFLLLFLKNPCCLYRWLSLFTFTGKLYHSYLGISGLYTFVNDLTLLTISRICLRQFGRSNRELWYTFGFNKLAYYNVVFPGRISEIHWMMPSHAGKLHKKIQVDSISITTSGKTRVKCKVTLPRTPTYPTHIHTTTSGHGQLTHMDSGQNSPVHILVVLWPVMFSHSKWKIIRVDINFERCVMARRKRSGNTFCVK